MSKSLPCSREVPSTAEPPLDLTQSCLAGTGRFQGVSNKPPGLKPPLGFSIPLPPAGLGLQDRDIPFAVHSVPVPRAGQDPSAELQGCTWALLSLHNVENHVLPWPLNKAQPTDPQQLHPFGFIPCRVTAAGLLALSGCTVELQDHSSHPQTHLQGDQTPFLPHFFSLGTPRHFLPTTGINIFLVSVPKQKGSVLMLLPKHSLSSRKIPRKVVAAGQGAAVSILGALPLNSPPEGLEFSRAGLSWGEGSPGEPQPSLTAQG